MCLFILTNRGKIDNSTNSDYGILPLDVTPSADGISTIESHTWAKEEVSVHQRTGKLCPVRASLLIRTGVEQDSGKERY